MDEKLRQKADNKEAALRVFNIHYLRPLFAILNRQRKVTIIIFRCCNITGTYSICRELIISTHQTDQL